MMTGANEPEALPASPSSLRALPRGIWVLGFVSFFMDVSSELIHSLLPIFLVTSLGASMVSVGLIEGVAEATAAVTKVFSGAISDYLGKRKGLTVVGYALSAITKPLFPLALSVEWALVARFSDRIGKGIRGAPRDAMIADLAPPHIRGAAFGLRQTLDTVGAVLGPLLAIALMMLLADDIRAVFWFATIPAVLAVVMLIVGLHEPDRPAAVVRHSRLPIRRADLGRLPPLFWWVTLFAAVMILARMSQAFLVLKADSSGLALAFVPLVMVVMNFVYAAAAYPVGALSDRIGRRGILVMGAGILVAGELALAFDLGIVAIFFGVALWGIHLGLTEGILAAVVADTAPADLRGTAFGVFNLLGGVAMLIASVLAGFLWDQFGPSATFLAGAAFAAISCAGFLAVWPATRS